MTREQAIEMIEAFYPADSEYEATAEIGRRFLEQAKREADDWRDEPDAVIFRYAELCRSEEERSARKFERMTRERY